MPPKANTKSGNKKTSIKKPRKRAGKPQGFALRFENQLLGKLEAKFSKQSTDMVATHRTYTRTTGLPNSGLRVSGMELLGAVSSLPDGIVMMSRQLNPSSIGVRLANYSRLFTKFCFSKMKFTFVPSLSLANPDAVGQIGLGVNFDPEMPFDDYEAAYNAPFLEPQDFMAWQTTVAGIVTSTVTCSMAKSDPNASYYISGSGEQESNYNGTRLTSQGVFVAAMVDSSVYDIALGNIYVEYECNLYEPVVHSGGTTGQAFYTVDGPVSSITGSPLTTFGQVTSILGGKQPDLLGFSSIPGLFYDPVTGLFHFPNGKEFRLEVGCTWSSGWTSAASTFYALNTSGTYTSASDISVALGNSGLDVVRTGAATFTTFGYNYSGVAVTYDSSNNGGEVKLGVLFDASTTGPVTITNSWVRIYEVASQPLVPVSKPLARIHVYANSRMRKKGKAPDEGHIPRCVIENVDEPDTSSVISLSRSF
jgi:hypothetical protein